MRIAYDSVTASHIPLGARIVCGYVDGIYQWSGADWALFPYAVKVGIAVSPYTNAGQVLDIETGDATPAQAPHWVMMRRAAGVDPTVYINRSNWAATRAAFQQQGIPEPHYWLAAYDGIAEVPPGTVAKQYANSTLSGGHYDLSAVADYWPGVDPSNPNATAGSEVQVQEDTMTFSLALALVRTQFLIAEPDIAPDETLIESWAHKITDDGNNGPDAVIQRMWSTEPHFAAYRTRLAAVLNAKPSVPAPHAHKLTATTDPA